MNATITLNLPEKINFALREATQEEGLSEAELIGKALEDYLYIRKFRKVRERMISKSQASFTDEEIFEAIS
jgi:hypothetical protein